jgi:hypothetical protein
MENRILRSILCLMIATPFLASAHTDIINPSGNNDLVALPAVVSEHSQSEELSFKGFGFSYKQDAPVRNSDGIESFKAVLKESGTFQPCLASISMR